MSVGILLCVLCMLCTLFQGIMGHAYLGFPVARTGTESNGVYKFAFGSGWGDGTHLYPQYRSGCRPAVADAPTGAGYTSTIAGPTLGTITTLTLNSSYDITWVITINHASAPGVQVAIDYNGGTNFTVIQSGVDVNLQKVTWTPTQLSDHAVIQWMWESSADGGAYLGCADIRITNNGSTPTRPNNIASISSSRSMWTYVMMIVCVMFTARWIM